MDRLLAIISEVHQVLYLFKFKAINYSFQLPKLNSGCVYSLLPYSASSITPGNLKNGPDCGYIVVLPKIEIFNHLQEKIREIGNYCIPISFVQTVEQTNFPQGRSAGYSQIGKHAMERRDERKVSTDEVYRGSSDYQRTANKYRPSQPEARNPSQDSFMKRASGRYAYLEKPQFGNNDINTSTVSNYTPTSFNHLRSIEHYVTPEPSKIAARPSYKPEVQERSAVVNPRNPKPEDFSFDVFDKEGKTCSPLDKLELALKASDTSNNGVPARENGFHRPSEIRNYNPNDANNLGNMYHRPPDRVVDTRKYSPPFKKNQVLNIMSQSPVTSPRVSSIEKRNSVDDLLYTDSKRNDFQNLKRIGVPSPAEGDSIQKMDKGFNLESSNKASDSYPDSPHNV